MSKVIGIDLGTTNSCVSVYEANDSVVIVNSEGKRTTPSVIGISKDGEIKVGDSAKRQAVTNPKNTVSSIKRFMGLNYEQSKKEAENVQYEVVNDNGFPKVSINDRKYTPQELSAMILQKMKKTAEDYLGDKVTDAVITVPAYFNDDQRRATKEAGEIAGLNVKRIINEPTAAALAFGVDKSDKDMNVVIYDIGGGTSDVSVLNFGGGVFEVISTNGNSHLGGDDIDSAIVKWIVDEFKGSDGIDLSKDPMAMQRLKEAAEKAKIELSTNMATDINLPYITAVDGTPKHLVLNLTRAKFEQLISHIIKELNDLCQEALKLSKLDKKDINEVILVGGSTRVPAVAKVAKDVFDKEPSHSVNPDEAVALGAAIQGAVLNNEKGVGDIVLLDVTPLDLGIETLGSVMTKLIDANSTIPCRKEETFSTAVDNQTAITVNVLQGNRPMAKDNKSLGMFNLEGIMPAKRGVPQIVVCFDIDANGILNVSAKDKATNKEQSIRIDGSSSLSKEEIERMKAEAEANAEADKKVREEADAVNKGDSIVFSQEKMLEEQKENLKEEEKSKIEGFVNEMKEAVKARNVEKINELEKSINDVWNEVSQRIYSSQSQQQTTEQKTDNTVHETASADDVQEADFEEVK